MIPTVWYSEKGKIMETVKTSVVARSFEEGEGMNRRSTCGIILLPVSYTSLYICENSWHV